MYEDDNNMRVLGEEEICHIFAEEEAEEEVQVGDIVSAIWLPNGQWYDAKVLQKGSEFLFLQQMLAGILVLVYLHLYSWFACDVIIV